MTNSKTRKWLSLVVIVALVLVANIAIGSLVLGNSNITASAESGTFSVSDMNVGDYIDDFGTWDGSGLRWRIVGMENGNALIRTDRALSDHSASGVTINGQDNNYTIKFDDITKGNEKGYTGNTPVGDYINNDVSGSDSSDAAGVSGYTRKTRGTNFWDQASIKYWLNDEFLETTGLKSNGNILKDQPHKQTLWWGDARDQGQKHGASTSGGVQFNNTSIYMDTSNTASNRRQLGQVTYTNGNTQLQITAEDVTGTIAHQYNRYGQNTLENYNTTAYSYVANDTVTLQDVGLVYSLSNSDLRNANGYSYAQVLSASYQTDADSVPESEYGHSSGAVATWTSSPMGEHHNMGSNSGWNRFSGNYGSTALIVDSFNHDNTTNTPRLSPAYADGVYRDGKTNQDTENVGVAPMLWLSGSTKFSNKYNASANPGEKQYYHTYTNENHDEVDGKQELASATYLNYYEESMKEGVQALVTDVVGKEGLPALAGGIDLSINGIGAFPRGLEFDFALVEDGTNQNVDIANIQGYPSLIDTEDTNINSVDFSFQVVLTAYSDSARSTISATRVLEVSMTVNKADPSQEMEKVPKLDENNNLVYNVGGSETIFAGSANIVLVENGNGRISALYEDIPATTFEATYGDRLLDHGLVSLWAWNEDPSTTYVGGATVDQHGATVTNGDHDGTDDDTDGYGWAGTNYHIATYRDTNNDFRTITSDEKELDTFIVKQRITSVATPTIVISDTTTADPQGELNGIPEYNLEGKGEGAGVWTYEDVTLPGETTGLTRNTIGFEPNNHNYANETGDDARTDAIIMLPSEEMEFKFEGTVKGDAEGSVKLDVKYNESDSVQFAAYLVYDGIEYSVSANYTVVEGNGALPDGIVLYPNGVYTGTFQATGTYDFTVSASISGNTIIEPQDHRFTVVVRKALLTETMIPTTPSGLTAVYGQKASDIAGQLNLYTSGWSFADGSVEFDKVTSDSGVDDNGNEIPGVDPVTVNLVYTSENNNYENSQASGITRSTTVTVSRASANDLEDFKKYADGMDLGSIDFKSGATLSDINLGAGWYWTNPSVTAGNEGPHSSTAFYNPDSTNYFNSNPIVVTYNITAEDGGMGLGTILAIVGAIVVVLAGATIAFVLINKKKATNTTAGSKGNRF